MQTNLGPLPWPEMGKGEKEGGISLYSDSLESISKDVVLFIRDPRLEYGAMIAHPVTKSTLILHLSSPLV